MTCSGTATFDTAIVGTGKTVTSNNLALSGAAAGNYTLVIDVKDSLGNKTARGQADFEMVN